MTIADLCTRVYGPIRQLQAEHEGLGALRVIVSPPDRLALLAEFREGPLGMGRAYTDAGAVAVIDSKPTVFGVLLESDYVLGPGEIILRIEVRV